jgi:AcrR family transcriptional regulator
VPPVTHTDGRRERSARTQARVVTAARELFLERGFIATTIDAVAERAGVAVQTIYYAFGTKPHLLAAVLDTTIAGDPEAGPVLEQPWVSGLDEAPDAVVAITYLVGCSTAIVHRTAPIYEVIRRASAEPEVAALLATNRAARRSDQRRLIEIVWHAGGLRPGLDLDTAADTFYAVMNEEVYELLVVDCGWALDRFESWATGLLVRELVTAH